MALIKFTARHEDLTTGRGYQFKFCCDECGSGHVTRHRREQSSVTSAILGFLDFFGWGRWARACWLGDEIEESGWLGKAHADAYAQAVAESRNHFYRCPRCCKWVCPRNCWNDQARQCCACAPDIRLEMAVHKAQAMAAACKQLLTIARRVEATTSADPDAPIPEDNEIAVPTEGHFCSECGGTVTGDRYCAACGDALATTSSAG
jgi:hypothetical protein